MFVSISLVIVVAIVLLVSALYIPLPAGICDRKKIQTFELLMRIFNEYLGDLVELCLGPIARNTLTRWLCALPFWVLQFGPPAWCIIRNDLIGRIRCRVYLPQGKYRKSNAAVIYIHGGGWAIMRPKYYDNPILALIKRTGTVVISIDYRLTPETRFPTPILECEQVLEELHKIGKKEYGIDKNKIILFGDSAGGNMCAVICQRAIRSGTPKLVKSQVLLYPATHLLDLDSPSYQFYYNLYKGTALLNPTLLVRWYLMYMGLEPSRNNIKIITENRHLSREIRENQQIMRLISHDRLPKDLLEKDDETHKNYHKVEKSKEINLADRHHHKFEGCSEIDDSELAKQLQEFLTNPDLCPILGENLDQLPPTLVCTAGVDILRDEGMLYAKRLKELGVPVQLNHYETAFHGFFNMPKSKQRRQLISDIDLYIQKILMDSS